MKAFINELFVGLLHVLGVGQNIIGTGKACRQKIFVLNYTVDYPPCFCLRSIDKIFGEEKSFGLIYADCPGQFLAEFRAGKNAYPGIQSIIFLIFKLLALLRIVKRLRQLCG